MRSVWILEWPRRLVTCAGVGTAQAVALRKGLHISALCAATVSLSWAVEWLVTANVIVDAENGYVAFGSSGAVVATAVTGLVLRRVLGLAVHRRAGETSPAAAPASVRPAP